MWGTRISLKINIRYNYSLSIRMHTEHTCIPVSCLYTNIYHSYIRTSVTLEHVRVQVAHQLKFNIFIIDTYRLYIWIYIMKMIKAEFNACTYQGLLGTTNYKMALWYRYSVTWMLTKKWNCDCNSHGRAVQFSLLFVIMHMHGSFGGQRGQDPPFPSKFKFI